MKNLDSKNNDCEVTNMYSKVKLYKQYINYSDSSECIGQYIFTVLLFSLKKENPKKLLKMKIISFFFGITLILSSR